MYVNFIILKKKYWDFNYFIVKFELYFERKSNFDLVNYCFLIIIWVCFIIRFGVIESMIVFFLEGFILFEVIVNNCVFIIDLEIFEGIDC